MGGVAGAVLLIARLHIGDPRADGLDDAGRFVPEQIGIVVTDSALRVAGRCGTPRRPGPVPTPHRGRGRGRDEHGGQLDRGVLDAGDDAMDLVHHAKSVFAAALAEEESSERSPQQPLAPLAIPRPARLRIRVTDRRPVIQGIGGSTGQAVMKRMPASRPSVMRIPVSAQRFVQSPVTRQRDFE